MGRICIIFFFTKSTLKISFLNSRQWDALSNNNSATTKKMGLNFFYEALYFKRFCCSLGQFWEGAHRSR
jgi:hypothetical protein